MPLLSIYRADDSLTEAHPISRDRSQPATAVSLSRATYASGPPGPPLDYLEKGISFFRQSRGEKMTKPKSELLQGTLDMLVLKTLALEEMHG